MITDVQRVLIQLGAFAILGDASRTEMRTMLTELIDLDKWEAYIDKVLGTDDDKAAEAILEAVKQAIPEELVKVQENA